MGSYTGSVTLGGALPWPARIGDGIAPKLIDGGEVEVLPLASGGTAASEGGAIADSDQGGPK